MKKYGITLLSLLVSISIVSCASLRSEPLTLKQKMQSCAVLVLVGAGIGGILGSKNKKEGDSGGQVEKGVVRGAAVAGGLCAVWMAFESKADKERIRHSQEKAALEGKSVKDTWEGDDGRIRTVEITPSSQKSMLPVGSKGADRASICRVMPIEVSVDGTSDTFEEIWCRGVDGVWGPAPEKMVIMVAKFDANTASLQKKLNSLGYNAGAEDGVMGPATRNALIEFQRVSGLSETGLTDAETLKRLGL